MSTRSIISIIEPSSHSPVRWPARLLLAALVAVSATASDAEDLDTTQTANEAATKSVAREPTLVRPEEFTNIDAVRRGNIDSVEELFDAKRYLRDTSDIVALLVFEHQAYVHNFITRANFKLRTLLPRETDNVATPDWTSLSPKSERILKALLDPLIRAMLFVEAAPLTDKIASRSGFDKWFESRGPRDARGRSLRQLELQTRIFKYRMSFLIYSEGFDALPEIAKEYVYAKFADVLSGRDNTSAFSHLSASERADILAILTSSKRDFAAAAKRRSEECARADCSVNELLSQANLQPHHKR